MRRKYLLGGILIYGISTVLILMFMIKTASSNESLTAMCLSSQFPAAQVEEEVRAANVQTEVTKTKEAKNNTTTKKEKKKSNLTPQVLIYHTHGTESYLPSYEGNYHRIAEPNTVRDAGNVLSETLEEEGIGVIHNKTLHDDPSYDGSYSRSYNTVLAILNKYPSIKCIIDLHRDATAAKVDGPTEVSCGKNCASYSYVLSNGTKTYSANKEFLSELNSIANRDYGGFSGGVLERPYWYNQELSTKAILIELGNNRNNITQVRASAEVFGHILANALK